MINALLVCLLIAGQGYAGATPSSTYSPPSGYVASNIDPDLKSQHNNEIYDPNFIPGFSAGLDSVSVDWSSGYGYAKMNYSVGPWAHQESVSIPHFAMGPQCCNFVEVPHTQQFRQVGWGDYYNVRAGFGPPGVNVENYTATFGESTPYVGIRTDWNWTLDISLNWTKPLSLAPSNEWAAIGVSVTQYVPAEQKLVYTLVNFWMDQNSSSSLKPYEDGIKRAVSGGNLVTYHPFQLEKEGNETLSLSLSPYLSDTLRVLNITRGGAQPPLISYVYLNVEGYNLAWHTTVWSYYIVTPQIAQLGAFPTTLALLTLVVGVGGVAAILAYRIRGRTLRTGPSE
jgi:hypothetical protein